ncbi:hypothetical protein DERP_011834 [Dermatophagoides pteronyssinus]|uniref:Uncharacterized protein n=1 Tax=Dermatophagoides pteronyssinus TaxID=6956 RepID=A0ABQ8JR74_DERPT|nr:hypothetical protein DERP_011834 [Dermatophagoides pteronyssinus]
MKFSATFIIGFLLANVMAEMTIIEKHRCEQYTSIFENDTTELQYSYCENIFDGRGYTSGRAGFCTGCGDALNVIIHYTAYKPNNPLAKFIPILKRLSIGNGNINQLNGYCEAWKQASNDYLFRQFQDYINDLLYYVPAMNGAKRMNITTALGKCSLYDTIIQHGGGNDNDSFDAILNRTKIQMNGPVTGKNNEPKWIEKFLEIRKNVLLMPNNNAYRSSWSKTIDRVNFLLQLVRQNNWNMDQLPIRVKTRYHDQTIYS